MFALSLNDIHPGAKAENKEQAIRQAADALTQAGCVSDGYLAGMLEREIQTSTFLGNGIAIPHGTTATRHLVQNTGVQVFQYPQGIDWGEGQTAYVVIGIAARSDEHLALVYNKHVVVSYHRMKRSEPESSPKVMTFGSSYGPPLHLSRQH